MMTKNKTYIFKEKFLKSYFFSKIILNSVSMEVHNNDDRKINLFFIGFFFLKKIILNEIYFEWCINGGTQAL